VADALPDLRVDEARMMQVFGNLISNALRHTPGGGKILLSARLCAERMELTVQDSGDGIATEELPHIFDRFHRVDKSRHSEGGETGLGLAIVKALVEAHGGTVQAESKPGEGTTLCITLPMPSF
jgi:signal transduction histidine kinase